MEFYLWCSHLGEIHGHCVLLLKAGIGEGYIWGHRSGIATKDNGLKIGELYDIKIGSTPGQPLFSTMVESREGGVVLGIVILHFRGESKCVFGQWPRDQRLIFMRPWLLHIGTTMILGPSQSHGWHSKWWVSRVPMVDVRCAKRNVSDSVRLEGWVGYARK